MLLAAILGLLLDSRGLLEWVYGDDGESWMGSNLGCSDPDGVSPTIIGGGLDVGVLTEDGFEYSDSVTVESGDELQFQAWFQNRSLGSDAADMRVRFETRQTQSIGVPVEVLACGDNTSLAVFSANVRSVSRPVSLAFVPGSVRIRQPIDGAFITREGSNAAFESAAGEYIGTLRSVGIEDADMGFVTVTVRAVVE